MSRGIEKSSAGGQMRISELSRNSGVPVPTIKFYLREGLLARGRPTASNQADYDEDHLHRLRLIRVLREVGGLSVARVRDVLTAVGDPSLSLHDMLGVVQRAMAPAPGGGSPRHDAALCEVDGLLASLGWRVGSRANARRALADALVALRSLGREVTADAFRPYADTALSLAEREVAGVFSRRPRAEAVERMVVGTVVFERVLTALRRLAHEHLSAMRAAGTSS